MVFEFGPYTLDVRERRLQRGSERLQLEPKVFDVLSYLVRHPGQLVKKQDLVDSVWSGSAIGDNSLTRSIHQIRAALGDSADRPVYLETVRGTGYRFIAPVRSPAQDPPAVSRVRHRKITASIAALAALTAAAIWIAPQFDPAASDQHRRIAVLPLENFSGDPGQDYFVDGIHEALIGELSHIEAFDVISRSSVLNFSRGDIPLKQIAAELDIDIVVEGSVAREGNGLSVSIQLVQIEPERNLWSGRFHRDIANVFEITTGLARSIAERVSVELSETEQMLLTRAPPVNEQAFDLYLRAQSLHRSNPPVSSQAAIELYREALDTDPEFALAYVGLADAIGSSIVFGFREPAEYMPVVHDLTETVLRLDSTLATAHRLDAAVQFYGFWDIEAAEASIRRALGLDPSLAGAYKLVAEVYAVSGRPDAAWQAIERGRALDPMPPVSRFKPALILYLSQDFARARELAIDELANEPGFWQGHWLLCLSSSALDFHEEAIAACTTAVATSDRTPMALGALGFALARAGHSRDASSVLDELYAIRESRYVSATCPAMILAALGQADSALDELMRAYEERDINLVYLGTAEYWSPLHLDARFHGLVDRVRNDSR